VSDLVSVERDCTNYSHTALLSDARIRTTKPGFVVGARAVISDFVTVIDRCIASRSGYSPKRPSGSLKYLDDAQLERLLAAVTVEINCRNQSGPKNEAAPAAPTGAPSQGQSETIRNNKIKGIDKIPEGTARLIRASFKAGVKPAAIARTFRVSQSMVHRVLGSTEKSK